MGYSGEIMKVLVWKHAVVRMRRFIHTTIEYLAPIALFVLFFCLRGYVQEGNHPQHDDQQVIMFTEPYPLDKSIARILYTPDTLLARQLMTEVGSILKLSELDTMPDDFTQGYFAVPNTLYLTNFAKDMKFNEAIVIFQNVDQETWPTTLNYTIRMKEPFLTGLTESLDGTIGPHERFGAMYEVFMKLQWAIDKSYLKMITGNPIDQEISLQEFPYVNPSARNASMEIVCPMLQIFCWLSLLLPFVFLVSRLLDERASGIQELVKMVGVTSNLLGISHFLNILPAILVYAIGGAVLFKISDTPIIPESSFILIMIALFLHFVSIASMAFACSYITTNTHYSTTIAVTAYMVLWIPTRTTYGSISRRSFLYMSGIYPHTPIYWFFDEISGLEIFGKGLHFGNIFKSHHKNSAPVLFAYIAMCIQTAFFFLLSWYLDKVRPGKYGIALPWNFILEKQYWTGRKVMPDDSLVDELDSHSQHEEKQYFEDPPTDLEVGIKIVDVTKVFGTWHGPKSMALSHVSLDIFKGEITVLLGHNGAGKTTLMSVITGMISATEGKVYVNGMDNVAQRNKVRRNVGLCPQNNLTFPDLTVLEHIMFFAMLKGVSYKDAKKSGLELVSKLNLQGKEGNKSSELSGGMKRRLQLACALAGDANVLILDEPTSGLDVETRRELWDLLLNLRGTRTVLLTTHFMEEADALGDRVAVMHAGRLKCNATPMYLKKAIGTGYRLTLTINKKAKVQDIADVIHNAVPGASKSDQTATTLSYSLPAKASKKFPQLFNDLEHKRTALGIETIGVGITTLEEVFLKLCSDVDLSDTDITSNGLDQQGRAFEKIHGPRLYWRQMLELFKRQHRATLFIKLQFIIFQCIMPVFIIALFTSMLIDSGETVVTRNTPMAMNMDMFQDRGFTNKRAWLNMPNSTNALRSIKEGFPDVDFVESDDVTRDILRTGKSDILDYNKFIVGLEVNNTNANLMYSTIVRHAAPVAVNLFSNVMAAKLLSWTPDGRVITTLNHPIEGAYNYRAAVEPKGQLNSRTWALVVAIIIMASLSNEVVLPCKERLHGSRHFHIMSGCPAILYWLVTWLYDMILYIVILVTTTVIIARVLDYDKTFTRPDFLFSLFGILVLGGMGVLWFVYFISFFFSDRVAGLVLTVILFIFGFMAPIIIIGAKEVDTSNIYTRTVYGMGLFFPHCSFISAVVKMTQTARLNAYCHLNKQHCPSLMIPEQDFDERACCESKSDWGPHRYFTRQHGGADILTLEIQTIVYAVVVILLEYGVFHRFFDRLLNSNYRPPLRKYDDSIANEEKEYVSANIRAPPSTDAAMIYNLHKKYVRIVGKSCYAVRGINLSIKKGECFGLLGVNGAGKSSTFKMLTADHAITRGRVYSGGNYLDNKRSKYLYSLGYCPQFNGLDNFMSGADNLQLLLTIRGLRRDDVDSEVDAWIQSVGLQRYANRLSAGYSGGCMRRLAAAAALSTGASVTLLDEPTAGVDAAARRRVWAALRRGLNQNRAVIITSHSMDEMEALCNRIAIMSAGEVCALGSPAALRKAHGTGYALRLKLKTNVDQTDGSSSDAPVNGLKSKIQHEFNSELKDEHKTMLHYHIKDVLPYSQLFTFLESLKLEYGDVLEDYSITETTLEEVFLSFAEKAPEVLPGGRV